MKIVSAARVKQHLVNFGLVSKEPDEMGTGEQGLVYAVHSFHCGKLVGHFVVVKWLRRVASFIKRKVAAVTKVNNVPLTMMMEEMITKMYQENFVKEMVC